MSGAKSLSLALAALSVTSVALTSVAAPLDCPAPRARGPELTAWRDRAIAQITSGNAAEARSAFARCFPTQIPRCLRAVDEYAEESAVGVARRGTPSPLMLNSEADLPPEFLVRDQQGVVVPGEVQIPPNIFELAATRNWKVVDYKTRSTGGFDSAPNLLIALIPNFPKPNQDIYLQISPPPDDDHPSSGGDPKPNPRKTHGQGTLTVITADKTVNPPVGQLRLMNGSGTSYSWKNDLSASGCISCHTVPLRAISPRGYKAVNHFELTSRGRRSSVQERPMSQDDQTLVDQINNAMHIDYMSWGFGAQGERLGPNPSSQPLGWAPPNSTTRTEAYIRACYDARRPRSYSGFGDYNVSVAKTEAELTDWVKLKNAMNCAGCHDGKTRGPMHEGFSFSEVTFKVLVDRSMPPQIDLTMDERLALLNCLESEKRDVATEWKTRGEWMKKVSCGL